MDGIVQILCTKSSCRLVHSSGALAETSYCPPPTDLSAYGSARLYLTSPTPSAALNLSLFHASTSTSGTPTLNRPVGSSGPYSDALAGVYIPPRLLSQGRYWLVPSTFAAGIHASFRLVVYSSDSRCAVSRWS